jgi:hypothetical protein
MDSYRVYIYRDAGWQIASLSFVQERYANEALRIIQEYNPGKNLKVFVGPTNSVGTEHE